MFNVHKTDHLGPFWNATQKPQNYPYEVVMTYSPLLIHRLRSSKKQSITSHTHIYMGGLALMVKKIAKQLRIFPLLYVHIEDYSTTFEVFYLNL